MKNYLKISIITLVFSSLFISCTTNDVAEGDITPELTEEQANGGKNDNRDNASDDDD